MKDNACMYVSTPRTGFPSLLSKRSLENCSTVLNPGIVETFCTMLTHSDNLYPETRLSSMPGLALPYIRPPVSFFISHTFTSSRIHYLPPLFVCLFIIIIIIIIIIINIIIIIIAIINIIIIIIIKL